MHKIGTWFSSVSEHINASVLYSYDENVHLNHDSPHEQTSSNVSVDQKSSGGSKDGSHSLDGATVGKADKPPDCDSKNSLNLMKLVNPKAYADKLVGSVGSFANKISNTKSEDVKNFFDSKMHILQELDHENKKFIEEQESSKQTRHTATCPVWKGCQDETMFKKQVLMLALDSKNFMNDPPANQNDFHFDYGSNVALAMTMLNEDPNLRKMRFQLVPKHIPEERFWRNYFYRISLIKQSIALRSMAKSEPRSETEQDKDEANHDLQTNLVSHSFDADASATSPTVEFLSDGNVQPDDLDPDLMAARQELGILSAESSPPLDHKREPCESPKDWESDILSDLNDDEFISKLTEKSSNDYDVKSDTNWEEEISELLNVEK